MYRAPNPKDSNLLAYWPMVTDSGSGLTPDASGNGRTGRLINRQPQGVPNYPWPLGAGVLGATVSTDQVLAVPAIYAAGDLDGDGVVEQSELNEVYDGYWQDNPATITNTLGLGQPLVKLAVDKMIGWDLTAQYSDDLATWSNLSNRAVPVFEFADPDATNHPVRTYRLLAP